MSQFKRVFLIALMLLLIAIPGLAQDGNAQVRFVHAIPGASAVDIYTDGQLTIGNLAYGSATNYIAISVGAHHIAVTQEGSTSSLWEQDITPSADSALTLVASTATQPTFTVFQDDLNPLPLGKARFTAIHAIADGGNVDLILADGRPVIPGLQYNQPYGTLDLPAMSYDLAVVPAGQPVSAALVPAQPFNLNTGTSYVALAYGTKDAPKTLLLSAPTRGEVAGGFARIVHVIPGAPTVDVYINNTLAAPSLSFGEATGYIALPAGSYTFTVRATGASTDLASGSSNLAVNAWQTMLIGGNAEAPTVGAFSDVLNAVNESTGMLSLINTSAAATINAASADGKALIGNVDAGKSNSALLTPSDQGINVNVSSGGATTSHALDLPGGVYGGVYYSAVAVDGSSGAQVVELPSVSIAQGIASSPGAQAAATSEPTTQPTPTLAPTEVAQAQPTPTQAPVNVEPTATEASGVQIAPQPTLVPTTVGPTARVLVDPNANLQLREYPSRDAFSLGLAPSGATLLVNGREGAPVPAVDTTATPLPPEATPYVDPATLLQPGEDLDPTQTWINVTYNTPDGGTITAWVLSVYVSIRDSQGRAMALRDLPLIPANRAGTSQNTSIQPPSATTNTTIAIATNVAPGVRVHIRRQPSEQGESLALVPAGTQMAYVGVNQDQTWVYVSYAAPDSTVTGWVNEEFVTLQRNGQPVDFARLEELGELNVIDESTTGSVVTNGQSIPAVPTDIRNVVVGTVVGLNPDANLQLRRVASIQGESLALMPNGTTFTVNAQNEDGTWLQVTYQNQTGWVSSQYVQLSYNGQPYDITKLPIITTTPTPSPTATLQG